MKLERLAAAGAALAMVAACGPRNGEPPVETQDPTAQTPPPPTAPPAPPQSRTPSRGGAPISPVGPKDTNSQMEGYGGADTLPQSPDLQDLLNGNSQGQPGPPNI